MYGRDELSLDIVISNLRSKNLEIKTTKRSNVNDVLYVRGRFDKKEKTNRGKFREKSNDKTKKLVRC